MKQNIHVKRYSDPSAGWALSIEPEDRSFVVFVPNEGDALFYRRVEFETGDGKLEHGYADVELPGSIPMQHIQAPELPRADTKTWPFPIDFSVEPVSPEGLDDLTEEQQQFSPSRQVPGFWAALNCRSIKCWGRTEHEAVQALMNFAISLAVAGSLDHTGKPIRHVSKRRYDAVFGPVDIPGATGAEQ